MVYVQVLLFIAVGIYALLILYFFYGWSKLICFKSYGSNKEIAVSVLLACRNEQDNISQLLDCLVNQSYPSLKTEILIINDHSTDNTAVILENYSKQFSNIKFYNLPINLSGKKQAIAYGVQRSSSEIIITTDADCTMNTEWLSVMVDFYSKNKPNLLSGPVQLKCGKSIFQKIQSLEFMSLIGSGAGAIGVNHSIMCNAANMLFDKSLYIDCNMDKSILSGDDIFLMLHAKGGGKQGIQFVKSKEAIVYTNASKSLNEFFNQRIRWTSKSKFYKDFDIVFTALIVSLTNLIMAGTLIYSIIKNEYLIFGYIFILKSFADVILLVSVTKFFKSLRLMFLFLPLQLIYPFYIVVTTLFGLIGNFSWKERNFR